MRRVFLLFLCAAALAAGISARHARGSGELSVSFLDVGQGDAIYIRTPSGNDMLIDGGRTKLVLERLSEAMPWEDREIGVVIATHPDADHIGGLPPVLERYGVGTLFESGAPSGNAIQGEFRRLAKEKGVDARIAKRGSRIDFGDGAVFDILFPDRDMSSAKDTNESSIVGELRYGSTTFMLTGDSPKKVEDHLLALDGRRLQSDVLKAGHHGSRTSSGEAYVKAVAPAYAVISSGKGNSYGHPHQETLDIFKEMGAEVLRTDTLGTITFVSDGSRIWLK